MCVYVMVAGVGWRAGDGGVRKRGSRLCFRCIAFESLKVDWERLKRGHLKMCLVHVLPGRVAQSVGHLTRMSGVLGSIPGLATYFRFSFRFFQEGQLSVTGESMCTKYWLTA